jgi:excisionase family DNA binding protein
MSYTVGQAAKATGKSKPTISRAIKTGAISATKNGDGSYTIDPAELHRVFPPVTGASNDNPDLLRYETPALQREIELLRQEREWERAERDAVIDDLRRRLDASDEERRKVQAQLTALLTDQHSPPRRSWWSWGKR